MNEIDEPIKVLDTSIRIKVNNDCQWACIFCHNEGTEVPGNHSKRVSVFLDKSTLELPPVGNMPYTTALMEKLTLLRDKGVNEAHLTGGEPTLHPNLPKIVEGLTSIGFVVKMTTNGQAKPEITHQLVKAGLKGITFSILSFDPEEFLQTQHIKSIPWANAMIRREQQNILLANELGVDVKINTVVLGQSDHPRVNSIKEFAQTHGIKLVLLNSLGDGEEAQNAVFDYVDINGRYLGVTEFTNSGKGSRHYILEDGTYMDAKYLRPYHPDIVCGSCMHKGKDSCVEKFYGLRMEFRAEQPYIRLCIQQSNERTVMPLMSFLEKDIISQL